jgi:eukaryotic-like serine/threonine-protein kinase
MKGSWLARDGVTAGLYGLVFAVLSGLLAGDAFQAIERAAYDLGVRGRDRLPSDRIAIVAIDDDSIRNLGRWPWPRERHAQMIDQLREAGAKVIASTVFYSEAQDAPERAVLAGLLERLEASPLTQQIPNEVETFGLMFEELSGDPAVAGLASAWQSSALATQYAPALEALGAELRAALAVEAADERLAAALRAHGGVVLPMSYTLGRPQGRPDEALPDYLRAQRLTEISDRVGARARGQLPLPTVAALSPLSVFGPAAAAVGHLNTTLDIDGAVRFEPLVLEHYDELYPSLTLAVAAQALNLETGDIRLQLGEGLQLGGLNVPTSPRLLLYTHYYGDRDGQAPFPLYAFYDVQEGKIRAENFRDKIVLIGATARGVGDTFPTPVAPAMAPVVQLAHGLSTLLQGDAYQRPAWAAAAEWGSYAVLLLWLAFAVPRLSVTLAAAGTAFWVLLLLVTQYSLLTQAALWLKLSLPALFVALGFGVMLLKRFNLTERLKRSSEAESAESNRMLGLAFQGQGQLDMAFEKFKRVQPVDDKLLDLLYNLALDFERKRQFNKAENVYQFIAGQSPDFRDIQQKLGRARKLSETVIIGGAGASHAGGTLLLDATQQLEKPMLGRYQVEKELGKGAMGIVYLGKDPKIGRQVAIKTMALSQEFEADELQGVKERFFREAETAGRLSHPNIVQIFDAGEEHDLAYIAMEFIQGHDLTRYVKKGQTPLATADALRFAAEAAEALDYAHSHGIIHRDIKPANMMLVEANRSIKLMDFGIARIADSSKTKTGMVLGTPSYMSPEQLSGQRVDGRSDLFSLGVTLYQLLTGSLPFTADSMATLMFRIANEPHAPLSSLRPDLPAELTQLLDRVLTKSLDRRLARGQDFAAGLRQILSTLP